MNTPATIRADGVDWPLASFLDAYRMQPVDRFGLPEFPDPGAIRLATVSDAGELRRPDYADHVDWHRTIAFASMPEAGLHCDGCGCRLGVFEQETCEDCGLLAELRAMGAGV